MAVSIQVDPSLMEEAVFLALRREDAGDVREMGRRWTAQRTALYEAGGTPEEREAEFQRLASRYFDALGFSEMFRQRLEEFPALTAGIARVVLRRAWTRKDERVELYVSPDDGSKTLIIELLASRCVQREALVTFLRHELWHIADMLDPAFAYEPATNLGGVSETEDEPVRERFRLLWDLSVHARMRRRGWPTLREERAWRSDLDRAFGACDLSWREALMRALLECRPWTHQQLLDLARERESVRFAECA